jgi:hypothetical protein
MPLRGGLEGDHIYIALHVGSDYVCKIHNEDSQSSHRFDLSQNFTFTYGDTMP